MTKGAESSVLPKCVDGPIEVTARYVVGSWAKKK